MNSDSVLRLARVRALVKSGAAWTARVSGNVSQGEMAEAVGVAPATISRWERGERTPRGAAALRYLEVLDRLLAGSLGTSRPGSSKVGPVSRAPR